MITLVANLKGGTGKSTIVFNFALWLAERGEKVRLSDLDPQATLRDVVEVRDEEGFEPRVTVSDALPGRASGHILADIGTSDMLGVHEGIRRANQILIPVAPSQADVWATQRFLEMIKQHAGGKKQKVLAFVNRADPHPRSRENAETLEALRSLPGIKALEPKLTHRLVFRRSFSEGLAVFEMEPSGKGARELDALAAAIFGG